jgi:hypothetical protein
MQGYAKNQSTKQPNFYSIGEENAEMNQQPLVQGPGFKSPLQKQVINHPSNLN